MTFPFRSWPLAAVFFLIILTDSCSSPLNKLEGLASVKYFEPEIAAFDSLNRSEINGDDAILFAGSSSVRFWSTIKEDMSPYPVIKRGFGGAKIEDMAWYLKRIIYPLHFRAIVFFVGTNNITGNGDEMKEDSILYWVGNVENQVRKKFKKVPIFWITATPTPSRESVLARVRSFNQRLIDFCPKHPNTYIINTEKSYLDEIGRPIPRFFLSDQLHMNHDGYLLWSNVIKKRLNECLDPVTH